MQIETITARKAVDNAFLQEPITETEFETFRKRLLRLIKHANDANTRGESEEYLKNLIKPFLQHTSFGEEYYINTKERQDLAIYNGKTGSSSVGVIIEAKRPSNKAEMITGDDLNRKAFHESILYYLRERIENDNDDIKYIIITDVYRWFIFNAQDFERNFFESKKLKNWYKEWNQGRKVSSQTKFVYSHLSEFVRELDGTINAAQVNVSDYRRLLEKEELSRDEQKKLVPLFKLFTPTHLLKLPFANDSNSLNKSFYRELLYIIGLKEYKEKGTHYITRLEKDNRQYASLIENTISQLKSLNTLSRLPNKSEYGESEEEQLFNVALQLLITWINRILFLKLLEAQLFKYHRGDERFRFLKHNQLEEFDDLNTLFFKVLAQPIQKRSDRINKNYGHIPYLNSSLFDVADIEQVAIRISELEDGLKMPVHSRSKIRKDGERLKGDSISALEYLLRFLDAYNFNTEGTAEVQKEAKTLINASVLGRIFEKINGYKDGSFFTPGYITEYMSRETIRRAVVQKFNEVYTDWNCETIDEVGAKISRHEVPYPEANKIVNSITICDPAVGSGHFLVSALNELIAIKNDLRILVDDNNRPFRDLDISVGNDELSIVWGTDPFFEYSVYSKWKDNGSIKRTVGDDTQRLQKALFREKNILIENSLFGVDINPNSVNICRLRLWIELLKHTYYRADGDYQDLEVLPNIDINIKTGNSLVSRFELDADLLQLLANNDQLTIEEYKQAVQNYKESGQKGDKQDLKNKIKSIKESFTVGLEELHPVRQELKKQNEILIREETKLDLFEGGKKTKKQQKKIKKTQKKITKLETELNKLESASFYDQAFEWRFEFPEVLDEEGSFTGFDVVIGNPPYIRQELLQDIKPYLKEHYEVYYGSADLYQYFVEKGVEILRTTGFFHYIISKKWMRTNYGEPLREWAQNYQIKSIMDFGDLPVFEAATVYPCLLQIQKTKREIGFDAAEVEHLDFKNLSSYIAEEQFSVDQEKLQLEGWSLIDEQSQKLLYKLSKTGLKLNEYVKDQIYYGIKTGLNKAFVINAETKERIIDSNPNSENLLKPFLAGRDLDRYIPPTTENYLIHIPNGWTDKQTEADNKWEWLKSEYPDVTNHLSEYQERAKKRYDQGEFWWELRACSYYDEFEQPKIMFPAIANSAEYTFDTGNMYSNDKTTIISKDDKCLLGILNSKLSDFFIFNVSNTKRGGYYEYKPMYVEKIPIVEPSDKERKEIEKLVDQILTAKRENPETDTSELEEQIGQLVYKLYGLSEEEIEIVEGSVG